MVNCPKCHFVQPKDQFCANCGIDMSAYRPVQPPLALRLAKNWIFQLSVFVIAVVVGVTFIRAKHRAQFAEGFAALEQVTLKQKNFLSKKPIDKKFAQSIPSQPQADNSPTARIESTTIPAVSDSQTGAQASAASASAKAADGTSAEANSPFPTKLKLVFAELSRTSFGAILGDTRNIASFGAYFSGILAEREEKSKSDLTGINVLDSANDLQIKLNQPIVVFKGSRDPQLEQNMGLTTQITPTFIDEQGAHLQIEVKRTLRAPAGSGAPFVEESFQEQMVLKKDSKGYMTGLLPHRILSEEESRVLGSNPTILKVLASSDFQNSNSEFVLFIEAK